VQPSPTTSATPTVAQSWDSTLRELDPLWGLDWVAFAARVEEFVALHPDFAPAKDKLYAALTEYAKSLIEQDQSDAAAAALMRAQALLPERSEAFIVGKALTPTPVATPEVSAIPVNRPIAPVAPSSARSAAPPPPAIKPAPPAPAATKCTFGTPGCGR
jgi:hypothetical protein